MPPALQRGGSAAIAAWTEAPAAGPDAAGQLLALIRDRRRRWRKLIGVEALLLALVLFLAFGGLATAGLLALPGLFGIAGDASVGWWQGKGPVLAAWAALVAAGLAAWFLAVRLRASLDLPRWAAEQANLEDTSGGAAELLRSALEIAQRAARPIAGIDLGSPLLVQRTMQQAEARLPAIDGARRQLLQRLWQFGLLLLLSSLAWLYSAVATPTLWRQLLGPEPERMPLYRDVGTLVGDSRIRVEPPPYARAALPARDEESGDVTVLRGARIAVDAEALPAFRVDGVEWQVQVEAGPRFEAQPVQIDGRGHVRWQRTAMESLRYRYRGRDADGGLVREQAWREVRTYPDAPPVVTIRAPQGEIEVKAGQTVLVDGEVQDDLGLSLVNMVIARPSSGVERRPVALAARTELKATVRESIAVDALQLRPGEVALVHLEAADNNPLDGGRRATSAKVRIRMFSAERLHARSLDQLAQLTETWTLRLADRLERDPTGPERELAWAVRNRAELAGLEHQALDGLRLLRDQLAEDVLSRPRTVADLTEIERQLRDPLADETRALFRIQPTTTGHAAVRDQYVLQRHHGVLVAAQEHAVEALGALAAAEHRNALARDGKSLEQAERQLVSTLEKLAEGGSAALQAEAERLLDAVEQQLDRMVSAAQEQLHVAPYEHVNEGGLDPSGLQRDLGDHRQALAEIRKLLRAGKVREALERMRAMQDQMGNVLGALQQDVDRQRTAEEAALERLVGELRRGIGRTQQGQTRLRDELRPASEEQERLTAEHLQKARQGLLPAVSELLQEARDQIRPQRLGTPAMHGNRAVAGARAALSTAQQALDQGQIDAALQALMEAEDLLGAARRALSGADPEGISGPVGRRAAADAQRLEQAAERTARAASKLRDALPAPSTLQRGPVRQRLEGTALDQEQLRRTVEKLRHKLGQAAGAHPALQRQVGDRLDHAMQTMRETVDHLQRYDAARAFDQMAETLDALERAASLLENDGQGSGPQRQQAGEQVGYDGGERRVELRQGNQGDGVETFRQDVLRAMQHRAPASYQERLQRYYKAIAR